MKQINTNLKQENFDLIEKTALLRGKSISDTIDEILSEYFKKEYRQEIPVIEFDESKEIWKDIPGYEGMYKASNMGRIASIRFNDFKIMSLVRSTVGYLQIALRVNNSIKRSAVHIFVAKTFLTQCKDCTEVDHINNIKSDNRVENLQWITRSDNIKYNYSRSITSIEKLKSKGKKVELFDKEGNSLGKFDKLRDAAAFLKVSHGNLSSLLSGKWKTKSLTKNKITAKFI